MPYPHPPTWTQPESDMIMPARRSDLGVYVLDDEAVISDQHSGQTHRLNATAWRIWQRCDGRTTLRAVARMLAEEFDIPARQAADHVLQLLIRLAEAGLLSPMQNAESLCLPGTGEPAWRTGAS